MKSKLFILTFALMGIFASAQAQQTATPKVTQRQVTQTKRIGSGVKEGELTKKEAKNLARQQKRINRSKKVAKSDGTVTQKERAGLHARQNSANRNIRRKKNNNRSRNGN